MTLSVRGTWVYDSETGRSVPKEQYLRSAKRSREAGAKHSDLPAPQVMRDIEPFRNVAVDGAEITSRSAKREMMKREGLVEVGNEFRVTKRKSTRTPVREQLKRAFHEEIGH